MSLLRPLAAAVCLATLSMHHALSAAEPTLSGVGAALQEAVAAKEIAGAVTIVATKDQLLHVESTGLADLAAARAITPESVFWIASMTKPVTGAAVLMLQDEGKLHVSDPVAKYLPEFAALKTPSGQPANLTITQILTHTSGLGEAPAPGAEKATSLGELVPLWLGAPMQFEPGAQWKYCQSGINAASRIVEVVSGKKFDQFCAERIFGPLGMKDTSFHLSDAQRARLATGYAKDKATGELAPAALRAGYDGQSTRPPLGNGGLFSTPRDYTRFAQMLLAGGTLDGRRYLSPEALKFLNTPQTGALPTGFFQPQFGANYGWGLGTCVLKQPHEGAASVLSPGSFGHGGAWGTQAWIDPVRGVAYLLFVQRANFPNSDASDVRRAFQHAAAKALGFQ